MSTTPRLFNLPAPPSDPVTPSDMGPSTPNSTTTSLSGISTTAIKDGHQGTVRSHTSRRKQRSSSAASDTSTTTLDAERADRISRLAGLERVAQPGGNSSMQGGGLHPSGGGYFDSSVHPHYTKDRSTVGSASATGSVGGRTTWASGSSDMFDMDRFGDDDGTSSMGGFSDENASLVGFGEGASSTVSGPISTAPPRLAALLSRQTSAATGGSGSPSANRLSSHSVPSYTQQQVPDLEPAVPSPTGSHTPEPMRTAALPLDDARMVDGMTFDANVIDTTNRPAPSVSLSQSGSGTGSDLVEPVQGSK